MKRAVTVIIAYLSACYIAALLIVMLSAPELTIGESILEWLLKVLALAALGALMTAAVAGVPSLIMIAISEWKRIQSFPIAVAFGALLGTVCTLLLGGTSGSSDFRDGLVFTVAGAAAGATYWMICLRSQTSKVGARPHDA